MSEREVNQSAIRDLKITKNLATATAIKANKTLNELQGGGKRRRKAKSGGKLKAPKRKCGK
jgi:hypothetical protein